MINSSENYSAFKLGKNLQADEQPPAVVPAGNVFGVRVNGPSSYALVGCTVAPGFEFADFEMPDRKQLIEEYPQHRRIIEELTR